MEENSEKISKCPVTGAVDNHSAGSGGTKNIHWWPNKLNLGILRQHSYKSNTMGGDFNYAKEIQEPRSDSNKGRSSLNRTEK